MGQIYKIDNSLVGNRLDKALTILLKNESRSFISKLIESHLVFVNDKEEKSSYKVNENDIIKVNDYLKKEENITSENIPLDIIYEDDDILIINKPQGMVVHPAKGHYEHTLVNALLGYSNLSNTNGPLRPGIVHRIDKDTSGLICIAKNDFSHNEIAKQLVDHSMKRTYIALVKGVIKENSGTINMPLGRDKNSRLKMMVRKDHSKNAITNFKVLKRFKNHTLVECELLTGRTHQIRVHFSAINFPIEGDPLYFGKNYDSLSKNGQLLTAIKLRLKHPRTQKEMLFEIPLPTYFQEIISQLE